MDRGWFSRNWYWITVIGVAVISFLVYLGWKHGIAISFAVLSIVAATFFASRSLKLTQDSLKLTRATQRPFLTLEKAEYDPHIPEIILYICNTGALPGDGVSVEISFMRLIVNKQLITGSISYPLPSIFPNEEKILAAVINNDTVKYINSGEEARIFVSIKYQSIEKECNTRRMLRWPTGKEARQHLLRLEVLEEGNYWD